MVCNRKYLLNVLRGWNANVSVASDNGDVSHLYTTWNIARNKSDAASLAMRNGLDQELSDGIDSFCFETMNPDSVDETVLNRAARNVLRLKFMANLFDNTTAQPDANTVRTISSLGFSCFLCFTLEHQHQQVQKKLRTPGARTLALDATRKSIVLLVNNETHGLPFSEQRVSNSRILITGMLGGGCDDRRIPSDKLCSARTALVGGYAPQFNENILTIEESFRTYMSGKQGRVVYKTGASACFSSNKSLALDAANEIRDNDLVLVVVGDTGDKDPTCETCGEGKDRTSLSLSGTQLDLTRTMLDAAIKRNNVSVVLVLIHGRPISFHDGVHSFDSSYVLKHTGLTSVISLGRPGPFAGPALIDLMLGHHQFYGKLSRTWPANTGQVNSASAPWFQLPLRGGGISDRYAFDEPQAPLFRFLHGIIPATNFTFSDLTVVKHTTSSLFLNISVRVSNGGTKAGSAVVAAFYSPPFVSGILRYPRRLVAFTRAFVNPGESIVVKDLVVNVDRDLTRWDEYENKFVLDQGEYGIHVGDCAVTGVLPQSDEACSHVQVSETVSIYSSSTRYV